MTILPGFRLRGRILALLRDRPMMAAEMAVRLPDDRYRAIQDMLPILLQQGDVKMIGQRYALADSEAGLPPDAA
jgi:hypothetical protein